MRKKISNHIDNFRNRLHEHKTTWLWGALVIGILAIGLFALMPQPKAEAQAPTPQIAKEYIHAGSRTLAVEDYGITLPNPTPTP